MVNAWLFCGVIGLACGQAGMLLVVILLARYFMKTLSDLQAAVAAENSVVAGAVQLISGLAQQIRNLPADAAAIDQLANDVQAQSDALAAAVAANTPAAPPVA